MRRKNETVDEFKERCRTYSRDYYRAHKERLCEQRNKRRATPEGKRRRAEWTKQWRAKHYNSERQRERYVKKTYGLSPKQYRNMLHNQRNRCLICLNLLQPGGISVDHDHQTNIVRGLLCHLCNSLIGMAGENVEILERAVQYIHRHQLKMIRQRHIARLTRTA
jgi:Recombination endonuclease VII